MFFFWGKLDMHVSPVKLNKGIVKVCRACMARAAKLPGTFSCFASAHDRRSTDPSLGSPHVILIHESVVFSKPQMH